MDNVRLLAWDAQVCSARGVCSFMKLAQPSKKQYSFCISMVTNVWHTVQFALKKGGESEHPLGKISFVDLAGSERGADTYDNNRCDLPPHSFTRHGRVISFIHGHRALYQIWGYLYPVCIFPSISFAASHLCCACAGKHAWKERRSTKACWR